MTFEVPKLYSFRHNGKKLVRSEVEPGIVGSDFQDQAGSWQNSIWCFATAADNWSTDWLSGISEEEIKKAQELRDKIMKLLPLAKELDELFEKNNKV